MIQILRQPTLALGLVKMAFSLILVGLCATLVAGLVGFIIIFVATLPLSLALFMFLPSAAYFIALGIMFATPVTLVLLPSAALLGRHYPLALYLLLPVIGAFGGFVAMAYWDYNEIGFRPGETRDMLRWAGLLSGFAAGGVFSAAVREMRK